MGRIQLEQIPPLIELPKNYYWSVFFILFIKPDYVDAFYILLYDS